MTLPAVEPIPAVQPTLFDLGGAGGYDEYLDPAGKVRPAWREVADCLRERGPDGLDRLRGVVRTLVDNDGITYIALDQPDNGPDEPPTPAPWRLDALPMVVSAADWSVLEAGLIQRSRLLDAVLADVYGEQRCLRSGVLPPALLFAHPGYVRAARGITVPGRHQLFLHGCDISRDGGGQFRVNADWTQAPSGAGYALADRRVIAHAAPDMYEQIAPRPNSPWAQALRLALVDAAPETSEEPVVVVLSPGSHSETAFDQAYLAGALGVPLVESADLVVREGQLLMRSMGTLTRVDVVLRRVDADYADPLDLRASSRLGVVGLVEVLRRGAVTVVNTLGSGVLESPGLQRFLPELSQLLAGETPSLATAPMYWGGIDVERSHLLTHLRTLLIRPVTGGEAVVGPELSAVDLDELGRRISAEPWRWVGQEAPEFSTAPGNFASSGLTSSSVGMRLFAVAQRGGYAPMIGGLGYVLAAGAEAWRLDNVAAKDVWIRTSPRATTEATLVESTDQRSVPAVSSPTHDISSPRVLSDLFWVGRYAERAEHTARLLTITRERFHEFRHRWSGEAGVCVPVLLATLGTLTGTDTGDIGDHAEMVATAPTTLWSLTADRHRPGSLAQTVERLGLAARAVRDQMSNDTWRVLSGVERALLNAPDAPPDSRDEGEAYLAGAGSQTLAGMLALSGVMAESMVHDVGWTLLDIGKRLERALALTALLSATLGEVRSPEAEQTVIESTLVVCESLVIYRRRNPGTISVPGIAELVLFDATNPRSLIFALHLIREHLRSLPGSSGSSRPQRLVDDIVRRLRRTEPADLADISIGRRADLVTLLDTVHDDLRTLAGAITTAHLSVPGGMQPLWGPAERRMLQ